MKKCSFSVYESPSDVHIKIRDSPDYCASGSRELRRKQNRCAAADLELPNNKKTRVTTRWRSSDFNTHLLHHLSWSQSLRDLRTLPQVPPRSGSAHRRCHYETACVSSGGEIASITHTNTHTHKPLRCRGVMKHHCRRNSSLCEASGASSREWSHKASERRPPTLQL